MIICVDLDSTLLRSDKSISQYTISTFENMKQNGNTIIINTARSYQRCVNYAKEINADYIICNGGTDIYQKETNSYIRIYNIFIPKEVVSKVCKEYLMYCKHLSIQTEKYFYTTQDNPTVDFVTKLPEKNSFSYNAYKIVIYKGLKEDIDRISLENGLEYEVYVNGSYGKVGIKGVDKYSGLMNLLKIKDLEKEDVIFFGDDIGDLKCLLNCTYGVAMKNSIPEVLEAIHTVCDSNDNDGVSKYLNKLYEGKKV